jgi:hypothetical protein
MVIRNKWQAEGEIGGDPWISDWGKYPQQEAGKVNCKLIKA